MFPDQNQQNGGQQPYQPPQQPSNYGPAPATPQQSYDTLPPPSPVGHPSGHNPYEFIVNPNTPKRSALKLFGGDPFLTKIALIIGGALGLMAVIALAAATLIPSTSSSLALTEIAQQQQEIIRVATAGSNQATAPSVRNYAVSTQYSVVTNQREVLQYLSKSGTNLSSKEIELKKNSQTDALLAAAKATSTYDEALRESLTTQLTDYQESLKTAYDATSNTETRALLQKSFAAAALLVQQGEIK
jgi:hypothetical protein